MIDKNGRQPAGEPEFSASSAAGRADARRAGALSAESLVQIGSVEKTLVAAGVLRLVTEERLTLEIEPTSVQSMG